MINARVREAIKTGSILRALFHVRLKKEKIYGKILDMGSGKAAKYLQFDNIRDCEIVTVGITPGHKPDIMANLELNFPFGDASFDNAFAFWFLEHIYGYGHVLSETNRILRKKGKFIFSVPFLHQVHGSPDDYFRYTKSTLKKILATAHFRNVKIEELGFGPFVVCYSLIQGLFPSFIKALPLGLCIALDKILSRISKNYNTRNYPLGYFVTCEK